MWIFALILWVGFLVYTMVSERSVSFTRDGVELPVSLPVRIAVGILLFPVLGAIFWILGYVGIFMLSPLAALF